MSATLRIRTLRIWPLAIPMRFRFEHAAAGRDVADPIIVQIDAGAPFAQFSGFGETLARAYVTGETAESVQRDIQNIFLPRLLEFRPSSFAEALDFVDSLPLTDGSRLIHAARAAVELAVLDLAGRAFNRRLADMSGWLDLPGFRPPGCLARASCSGIVVGRGPRKLTLGVRLQRCYGLRDFKIKVAVDGWEDRLRRAARLLRPALRRGRATLRADANAGWTLHSAMDALPLLRDSGVCALEQPLAPADDARLPEIAHAVATGSAANHPIDLIADESLRNADDAERLIAAGAVRVLNIRIAKCGGLLPSLRLAHRALTAGLDVQLGCLVGETSVLSAAGAAFLELCPRVRFVEGAYGRFLLSGDIVRKSVTFGRGGRLNPTGERGLGVEIEPTRLQRYTPAPQTCHL